MRPNCNSVKILLDYIVMNGIKKYYYITLTGSINCVVPFKMIWLVVPNLEFCPQIWGFQCFSGFFF